MIPTLTAFDLSGQHIGQQVRVNTDDGYVCGRLIGVTHSATVEIDASDPDEQPTEVIEHDDVRLRFLRGFMDVPGHAEVTVL